MMTETGERTAKLEEAFEGVKQSVDFMRGDVREMVGEMRGLGQRVVLLEVKHEWSDWWLSIAVKVLLPLILALMGLGLGAYIQRVAARTP